jgi:hypothetical protein
MTWVAAGVAVVGGGIQVYRGIQQKKEGKEAEIAALSSKPEFTIPPEIAKNMSEAEMRAYQGLPDEQKSAFLDNQQRAAQTALRSSSDRRGGLGMISQIQAQQDRSSLQLLQADVSARDKNILRAQEARNVMASYRDKRFEHEYNEYSADLDYARAQVGAGMQNVAGGLTTAAGALQSGIAHHESSQSDKALFNQQQEANRLRQQQIDAMNNPGTIKSNTPEVDALLPTTTTTAAAATTNPQARQGVSDIPLAYKQQTINFAMADEGSSTQKKIVRDMFRKVETGDMGAFNWIHQNLRTPGEDYQSLNFGDLASQYGGKRFGRRWSKRNQY